MQDSLIYISYFSLLAAAAFFRWKEDILSIFWPDAWNRWLLLKRTGDLDITWQRNTGRTFKRNNELYDKLPGYEFRNRRVAAWFHEEGDSMPRLLRSSIHYRNDSRLRNAMEEIDVTKWHAKKSPLDGLNWYVVAGIIILCVVGYYVYQAYMTNGKVV